jgi:gluconolactonase
MRSTLLAFTLGLLGTTAALAAQVTPQMTEGPGLKAAEDARDQAILAACHTPPPPRPTFRRPPRPAGRRTPPPAKPVKAIPGVIAAGRHWKIVWHEDGNNADGIIPDGNDILVAQQDNSDVVRVTPSGHATVIYRNTNTGGALSRNKQGQLFDAERGYLQSITQLAPEHKVLANQINGDSLDCLGATGGLNDLAAAANGGVYFTAGNLYYAAPDGTVTRQGTVSGTNGIVLSPDEKTLYVTSGGFQQPGYLVAFDVQSDGMLSNQRNFARLPGGGDGSTIDSEGRIYVSSGGGVDVISPDGQTLGFIPGPRGAGIISLAFGGPGKHTLYAVALYQGMGKGHRGLPSDAGRLAQAGVLASIPMLSHGYEGRAK